MFDFEVLEHAGRRGRDAWLLLVDGDEVVVIRESRGERGYVGREVWMGGRSVGNGDFIVDLREERTRGRLTRAFVNEVLDAARFAEWMEAHDEEVAYS